MISGAASCFYNEATGGQTLIQLDDASIIRWDHLALEDPGSSLTFEWLGSPDSAPTVLNRVEQGGRQEAVLGGTLSFPNGNLIITHPNTGLNIFGTVEAGTVTIVTHNLDSLAEMQLLDGQSADFRDASVSSRLNVLGGKVIATSGDVVLGGPAVIIGGGDTGSEILAPAGSIRIFGGQNFRLLPQDVPAGTSRIEGLPGRANGNVINSQTVRAERMVEIVAESDIKNNGILEADGLGGVVMMRVDANGTLTNEEGALISADIIVPFPLPGPGTVLHPDRGDAPSPLSTGLSRIPVVASPGQGESSKRVVLRESAPVTGSASAQRQRANRSRGEESSNRNSALAGNTTRGSGHLARGRSFFGVRGGTKAKKP
ncbi:MAG: hypothetical protein CMP31_05715 [Roseibacillus sp.]|nr:hypothetical protein [Roseibacillus sp.]